MTDGLTRPCRAMPWGEADLAPVAVDVARGIYRPRPTHSRCGPPSFNPIGDPAQIGRINAGNRGWMGESSRASVRGLLSGAAHGFVAFRFVLHRKAQSFRCSGHSKTHGSVCGSRLTTSSSRRTPQRRRSGPTWISIHHPSQRIKLRVQDVFVCGTVPARAVCYDHRRQHILSLRLGWSRATTAGPPAGARTSAWIWLAWAVLLRGGHWRQPNCQDRLDRPNQKPSMTLRFARSPLS